MVIPLNQATLPSSGELVGMSFDLNHGSWGQDKYRDAFVRKENGRIQPIRFFNIINCAGPWAANVARLCKIGIGKLAGRIFKKLRWVERRNG